MKKEEEGGKKGSWPDIGSRAQRRLRSPFIPSAASRRPLYLSLFSK